MPRGETAPLASRNRRVYTGFVRCLLLALWFGASVAGAEGPPGRVTKAGSVSPLLSHAVDRGPAPANERHRVVVGLGLRNREDLEAFLVDVQDPRSPRYRRFLMPAQFAER